MDNNKDFFKQTTMQPQEQTQAPEMVSVGEKQYSQEELQRLVGLGETASVLETKWNTPVETLMPAYTKATQEREELRKRLEEQDRQAQEQARLKAASGQDLTKTEQDRLIKEEAERLGLLTEDKFESKYQERREKEMEEQAAKQLIDNTTSFLNVQAKEGKPSTSTQDLLQYMQNNGISNYEAAYKIKYEKELDDYKARQLNSIRPTGMYTQSMSTAGAKTPEERRLNPENLVSAIDETLSRYK